MVTKAAVLSIVLAAAAPAVAAAGTSDWPMYNRDAAGSRTAPERLLSPKTVSGLRVKWRIPVNGAVHATPAVVGDTVYAGDTTGTMRAVAFKNGAARWTAKAKGGITGSALVTGRNVIFGDMSGAVYGLRRDTGAQAWPPLRPNPHVAAIVQGSATPVSADEAVIGIASGEELMAGNPAYTCCSFRGSVAAFNPVTGKLRWQTYLISEAEAAAGSSGAAVWSTPTYDPELDLIFVSTGNNYTGPTTPMSDAIVALDPDDGRIVWSTQLHANDIWTIKFPPGDPEHPDFDFGDSPQVFRLADGRTVVGAGQKSGFFHILDARTGRLLTNLQVLPGGHLGGLFADSAFVAGTTYANGSDWPAPVPGRLGEGGDGHVMAIRSTGRRPKVLWDVKTPASPDLGAVAVANGVVYFLSSRSGDFYAVDARTGKQRARLRLGSGIAGPSISRGRVFVGTGDAYGFVNNAGVAGALYALGLPGS